MLYNIIVDRDVAGYDRRYIEFFACARAAEWHKYKNQTNKHCGIGHDAGSERKALSVGP